MKEQSSFRERAKFSWRILCSRRRILQSPIRNEHPGVIFRMPNLCRMLNNVRSVVHQFVKLFIYFIVCLQ